MSRVNQSTRCKAMTKLNKRCKCRTVKSLFCWVHLKSKHNLRITASTIPEAKIGLFSTKEIKPRTNIVEYTGDISTEPIDGAYVLQLKRNLFIDAKNSKNIGGYANECRNADKRAGKCPGNNTRFSTNRQNTKSFIQSIKKIPADSEIFVPYGGNYEWRKK